PFGRQQDRAGGQPDPGPADESAQLAVRRGAERRVDAAHLADDLGVQARHPLDGTGGPAMKNRTKLPAVFLGVILVILYLPIALVAVYSFNDNKITSIWSGFSLRWYETLFADSAMFEALVNSVVLGVCASFAAAVIGTL